VQQETTRETKRMISGLVRLTTALVRGVIDITVAIIRLIATIFSK